MKPHDVLACLHAGDLSVEDADRLYGSIMDSANALQAQARLGLSAPEWTAFCFGVGFSHLARWRYQGWPAHCPLCQQPVPAERFGWSVTWVDGAPQLRHLRCPELRSKG
jgi:hypothetical protein